MGIQDISKAVGGFAPGVSAFANPMMQILTNIQNGKNVDKTNEMNLQIWREQMAHNEKMWHMENAYNTPYEQMQRLRQAGLNPDLMYQQGTTGIAQAQQQSHAPTMEAFTGNVAPQIDATSIQNQQLINQQIKNLETERQGKETENLIKGKELKWYERIRLKEEQKIDAEISNLNKDLEVKTQQIQESIARSDLYKADKIKSEQQAKNLLQEWLFNEETKKDRIREIRSRYKVNEGLARYYDKQCQLVALQMLGQETKNEILKKECNAFEQRLYNEERAANDKHSIDYSTAIKLGYENRRLKIDVEKDELRWDMQKDYFEQDEFFKMFDNSTEKVGKLLRNLGLTLENF